MRLVIEQNGNCATVKIWSNRLDQSNSGAFLSQLGPLIRGCARVVIDMQRVLDIDPHGVGSLLTCRHRLKKQGGRLLVQQGSNRANLFPELIRRADIFYDPAVVVPAL
ncbi:MAG: STAS domain-containing protein [Candidatus Latescibacteria bacterium]|nr:STAS domain-containing protein [Candidatus Latescibacterota bacterium]